MTARPSYQRFVPVALTTQNQNGLAPMSNNDARDHQTKIIAAIAAAMIGVLATAARLRAPIYLTLTALIGVIGLVGMYLWLSLQSDVPYGIRGDRRPSTPLTRPTQGIGKGTQAEIDPAEPSQLRDRGTAS